MVILFVIIAIVLIVKFVSKKDKINSIGNYNENENRISNGNDYNNELMKSPYYHQYKTTFELIKYNGKQPKYKIDWLLYSLNQGKELENNGTYVIDSMNEGLPYFCETENELDLFIANVRRDKRCLNDIDSILSMIRYYLHTNQHPYKLLFWKKILEDMAESGNFEAQGALCGRFTDGFYSLDEKDGFVDKYKQKLIDLSDEGNAEAQFVVGKYLMSAFTKEQVDLVQKAANQGITNAWYFLSVYYTHCIYNTENLTEKEKKELEEKEFRCKYQGAKAENGTRTAECQYTVSLMLEDDHPEEGEYWKHKYTKNLDNMKEQFSQYLNDFIERNYL